MASSRLGTTHATENRLEVKSAMATLLSGGTGYIGHKLLHALASSGEQVHLLLRKQSDRTGLEHPKIRLFEGNILDKESLRRAVRGCTRAYHLAAYARVWAPSQEVFLTYNVGGLRNVLDVCVECGVERVVFTSSALTIGPTDGFPANELFLRGNHFFTEYEHSKYLAEKEATTYVARGLQVMIVNPTRVYGPGRMTEANAVTRMFALYGKGKFPLLLGHGEHVGNYVFVNDVVNGHRLAMEKGRAGERYILGGENASLRELFDMFREVTGIRRYQTKVPPWVARKFGQLEELRARMFCTSPFISRGWVETFLHDWAVSSQKASNELGFTITPLREGISRTWKWLVDGPGKSFLDKL